MANGKAIYGQKSPDTAALAIAGGVGLGILALLYLVSKGSEAQTTGPTNKACLVPGEQVLGLGDPLVDASGVIQVPIGQVFDLTLPFASYVGPGRDLYSAARIVQKQGNMVYTVYGSGIAGIHVFNSPTGVSGRLVPDSQIQPPGAAPGTLRLVPFPGALDANGQKTVNPICGMPPLPGKATLILEVFGRCTAADADGYSSVTCNNRVPLATTGTKWADKILFT